MLAVVGRVLKNYTQVKVQLLPSKSSKSKCSNWKNYLSKSKKVLCYKVTQITSYFTFLYCSAWISEKYIARELVNEREKDVILKHFFIVCIVH